MENFKRAYSSAGTLFFVMSLVVASVVSHAEVSVPTIFGSHMVLQRDIAIPVWGWADVGEEVTVSLGDATAKTTADTKGCWRVDLPARELNADGLTLRVSAGNILEFTDVLIGDVWICSGQSNMEMRVGDKWGASPIDNADEEIANANFPRIRFITMPNKTSGQPLNDAPGAEWKVCTPESTRGFSATGFFFGRMVHLKAGIPIGLIDATWGGTRIEPWTPPEGFRAVPALKDIVEEIAKANTQYRLALGLVLKEFEQWIKETRAALHSGDRTPPFPKEPEHSLNHNQRPTGLYNAMVHPFVPYAIKGAIWYQGESNRGEGLLYRDKMEALIAGWREIWRQGDFPFYFVQLAPYRYTQDRSNQESIELLPAIWEAQRRALAIPNTGMAVTTDIGMLNDIHPTNKQDVGKRLALWALAKTYGKDVGAYSGPLFKEMETKGAQAILHFDHVGSGLTSRDGKPLTYFQIAGEDGVFKDATAEIVGDTVVLTAEGVDKPVDARFAWDELAEPNLMNMEKLPASPFTTQNDLP